MRISELKPFNQAVSWLLGALMLAGTSMAGGLDPALPCPLDLTPFYVQTFLPDGSDSPYHGFAGLKIIDGLPFHIDGKIVVYGQEYADRGETYSYALTGIKIGHKFDELHVIHAGDWRDYYGCPVATLRLHYADGTMHDFTIRFDFQVNDWNRLLTEDAEIIADPETKIVWRGPGVVEGTGRLFKSVLHNPFPQKKVDSMDVISDRSGMAYVLVAATIAQRDPKRAVTPPLPRLPSRNFAGSMNVHVVDAVTGAPIAGAKVYPAMSFSDVSLVADNVLTGPDGIALIKYPKPDARDLRIRIACAGYLGNQDKWENGWDGASVPSDFTVQLTHGHDPTQDDQRVTGHWKPASGSPADADLKSIQLYLKPKLGPPPFPSDANTPEKKQAWLQNWTSTEAGRKFAEMVQRKKLLEINSDGTFSGEAVAPGDYLLVCASNAQPERPLVQRDVYVPPNAGSDPAPPNDLGEIEVGAP